MTPFDIQAFDDFTASVDDHAPALWTIWSDWGGADNEFPTELAQQVADRGSVPMIWWEPVTTGNLNDTTFANERIIAGDFDEYIRTWARAAKAHDGLVVVRFAHEMDGNWFPWGVGRNGNTAANFVDAWRHVWNIFRGPDGEQATNVRFLWSPYNPTASIYPGNQYVDYVGFTALNWASSHGQPWLAMNLIVGFGVSAARQFGKAMIVAELGTAPDEQGGSKASWIQAGYAAVYSNYPDVVAVVYFNVDTSPGQPDWRLTNPPAALDAYRTVLANPEFQGELGASADTSPPVISAPDASIIATAAISGRVSVRISWSAATDDSQIVAYELQHRVNNQLWKTVTLSSSTTLQVDLALRAGNSHSFRLRASDSAGNWSAWVTSDAERLDLYQENSRQVKYTGAFRRDRLPGASGGQVRETSVSGGTARLTFVGTSVAWVSTVGKARGVGDLWLDNTKVATIDLYGVDQPGTVVWATEVAPGPHVLEVRVTGSKNALSTAARVDIDAFLVLR